MKPLGLLFTLLSDETDYDEDNLYGSGPQYTKDLRNLKRNHHLMIMVRVIFRNINQYQ